MIIQINSEQFNVLKLYTSKNKYTVRISKDLTENFETVLRSNDSLTIQDGIESHVISDYTVGGIVVWDNFVDFTIELTSSATVITKADLDNIAEQITNIELALCEIYENSEV